MKQKLYLLLLALFCQFVAFSQTFTTGGIIYNVIPTTTNVRVSEYQCYTGDLILTSTVSDGTNNYILTEIGDWAFESCSGLTSIFIPNTVTTIGYSAFSQTGLSTINIPNSVTTIADSMFSGCISLTSVNIPNTITSIGSNAFSGCTSLLSIEIPNSVTSIGSYAFLECTNLTTFDIPNSVTTIGFSAFFDCTGLTTISIGNSVTNIGNSAFLNCTSLTSITCLVPTPLSISESTFGSNNGSIIPSRTLSVSDCFVSAYSAAPFWSNFTTKVGIVTPAPAAAAQFLCPNKTVADLIPAPSTTIKWYDSATSTTALASTTALIAGDYFVSQTVNSCESAKT